MISKEELIAGLHEAIYAEEGMITTLSSFSKGLLEHAGDVPEDRKNKMKKILTRLYNDSSGHKKKIEDLIEMIDKGGKNEY